MGEEWEADQEWHIARAEYHLACARGAEPEVHPAEFRLPTRHDLAAMRHETGLSQSEAAQEIGYSQGTITNVEKGRTAPGRELIMALLALYLREWPAPERDPDA